MNDADWFSVTVLEEHDVTMWSMRIRHCLEMKQVHNPTPKLYYTESLIDDERWDDLEVQSIYRQRAAQDATHMFKPILAEHLKHVATELEKMKQPITLNVNYGVATLDYRKVIEYDCSV